MLNWNTGSGWARTRTVLAGCFAAAAMAVTSCRPMQEPLVAKSLLDGEPCGPPCWQGLVPGASTEQEVHRVLATSRYVDAASVYTDRAWGTAAIRWQRSFGGESWNLFNVQDTVLQVMRMDIDSEVTLQQILDAHGHPDKFHAGTLFSGPVVVAVDLFYREPGMMVGVELSTGDPNLTPQTRALQIWYFEPAPLDDVLTTIVWKKDEPLDDQQLELLEQWLEGWHDWRGYGPVEPTY